MAQHGESSWEARALAALEARDWEGALLAVMEGLEQEILAFCILHVGDYERGREVAYEVFADVWEDFAQYRGDAPLRHWIFTIANNQCKEKRKGIWQNIKRFLRLDENTQTARPDVSNPEEILLKMEVHERLRAAMQRLTGRERELILLRYSDRLSLEEIGRHCHVSRETARQRLLRVEDKLRRLMDGA
jgi:RNA polymerase sigma-70 factor, ECF subfamily